MTPAELPCPLETLWTCNRNRAEWLDEKDEKDELDRVTTAEEDEEVSDLPAVGQVGAETRLLVLRRRSRLRPGRAGPLLQGEELSLPPQAALLPAPLQGGGVTVRRRDELTAGPGTTRHDATTTR